MTFAIFNTIILTIYFSMCLLFIIKRKNIIYPKYEGPLAVMQGMAGIIGGILWIVVFNLLSK